MATPAASPLLQPLVAQLPWAHNMLLLQAVKDEALRAWYAGQTLAQGWSRNVLKMQIDTAAHQRQGSAITNFAQRLPAPQSDLAHQVLKDPYVVDDALRHPADAPTIGLMLCQDKNSVLAEYALRGIDKPIGIASYELTRSLPANLQSALPSIEAIEAELRATGAGPSLAQEQDTE